MQNRFAGRHLAALVMVGFAAACGGGDAEEPEPAPAPPPAAGAPSADAAAGGDLVAQGMEVYTVAGMCSTCHGPSATGTALAPNLTDDTWLWADPAQPLAPQIASVVRQGVPTPKEHPAPMPPMGGASLTDAQINAVAAYVASL